MSMQWIITGGFEAEVPGFRASSSFPGESVSRMLPPIFFSSRALLKITVKPSAEAGSLTSHSPNFGKGRPCSC